jgi:hypothetical protein
MWRATPLFLETFGLASLDELYQVGRKEQNFAPVFGAEFGDTEGDRIKGGGGTGR